jgi:hypothetical protein
MIPKGYIKTYTGKLFNPFEPDPNNIEPLDIAYALSGIVRFTGHAHPHMTVAHHSVMVSDMCPIEDRLWGLLHDSTEAYLSDIAKPIKQADELDFYRDLEEHVMQAICKRFLLPFECPPAVKKADCIMLWTELRDLMNEPSNNITLPWKIEPWDQKTSMLEFLKRCSNLGIEIETVVL